MNWRMKLFPACLEACDAKPCRTFESDILLERWQRPAGKMPTRASKHARAPQLACKIADLVFIPSSQRVFEITPLVPGSPSLDVRSRSPGETRRWNFDFRFAIADL